MAALLLALVVFLVLVMPQVDLDNGVVRDAQYQTLLFMMALASALIWSLPSEFFYRSQDLAFQDEVALCSEARGGPVLRC